MSLSVYKDTQHFLNLHGVRIIFFIISVKSKTFEITLNTVDHEIQSHMIDAIFVNDILATRECLWSWRTPWAL